MEKLLTGSENYTDWIADITASLMNKSVYSLLTRAWNAEMENNQAEIDSRHKAIGLILSSLCGAIRKEMMEVSLSHPPEPKRVMEELQRRYGQPMSLLAKQLALEKYQALTMGPLQSIRDFYFECMEKYQQARSSDSNWQQTEEQKIRHFINAIVNKGRRVEFASVKDYLDFNLKIIETANGLSLNHSIEEVRSMLETKESEHKMLHDQEHKEKVLASVLKNQASKTFGTKDKRVKFSEGDKYCSHCDKLGHNRDTCWALHPHLKEEHNQRRKAKDPNHRPQSKTIRVGVVMMVKGNDDLFSWADSDDEDENEVSNEEPPPLIDADSDDELPLLGNNSDDEHSDTDEDNATIPPLVADSEDDDDDEVKLPLLVDKSDDEGAVLFKINTASKTNNLIGSWIADSGASAHVTSSIGKFTPSTYRAMQGKSVHTAEDRSLAVKGKGDVILNLEGGAVTLKNVLHCSSSSI